MICRHSIAAAIEGQDAVQLIDCSSVGQLSCKQELQVPGVFLPTQVHFDQQGQLWVVGGPLSGTRAVLCVATVMQSDNEVQMPVQLFM